MLTDAEGNVSTAGVITSAADTVQVVTDGTASSGSTPSGILDMVGYGLHHVLDGADHLLFLVTLLLTAPLVAVGGQWLRRTEPLPTARGVLGVVTSFTIGHSITLIAAAMGWVQLPTRLIEVLVAASVAVAAVHALRPLVRRGENLIAAGFGLVHGLAFAGILSDLGLAGTTSVPSLLAFNVGVELAQLRPRSRCSRRSTCWRTPASTGRFATWSLAARSWSRSAGWSSGSRWPRVRSPARSRQRSITPGTWSSCSRRCRVPPGWPTGRSMRHQATRTQRNGLPLSECLQRSS